MTLRETSGSLDATGRRFAIVVARFNEFFTRRLLEGAVDALLRHGAAEENLFVAWVPGTFEIPLAVGRLAASGRYDAVIGLGVVIKGETSHHRIVASEAARGVAQAALATGVPCPLGIVTVESLEQAIDRAGGKQGNRGWEAAMSAIEMVNLLPALGAGAPPATDARRDQAAGNGPGTGRRPLPRRARAGKR